MFQKGGGADVIWEQLGLPDTPTSWPGSDIHEAVAGQVTSSTCFCTIALKKTEQLACGPFSFLACTLHRSLSQL